MTTTEARSQAQEPVSQRKIYNVAYKMEDAMISEETFVAGTSTLINGMAQEVSMVVNITYQDNKSYTFSQGVSLTPWVNTTIEAGVPLISDEKIKIAFDFSGSFQWDIPTTITTSVTVTDTVSVPAKSTVTVSYAGTKGTCNIPYSYTQEDQSVTGETTDYSKTDGIYVGVSYYNFNYQVKPVEST